MPSVITAEILQAKFKRHYDVTYEGLIELGAGAVVVTEMIGDYQGDYHFLVKDGENYAHVVTGYGSCSGCDALQDCEESFSKIAKLGNDICGSVIWKSQEEILKHIEEHDAEGSWYGKEKEQWASFQQEVRNYFSQRS